MKRILSVLMSLLSFLLVYIGIVSAAPADKETANTYHLALQALKGKDGVTDLYVKITPKTSGAILPDSLKKIQLKSYDLGGKLIYVKNLFNVAASPDLTVLKLNDVDRYQALETKIHLENNQTTSQELLSGKTTVLLKPDLVIDDVQATEKVNVNVPFTVTADIKELNGDIGAKATIQILDGSKMLDSLEGLVVNAGGHAQVVFTPTLPEAGNYSLRVNISGVEPGDYDDSNNDMTINVQAVESNKTVDYRSNYEYTPDYEDNWKNQNGESHQRGSSETFGVYASTPDHINPEEVKLTLTSETGKQKTANVTLSYEGVKDGYPYWSGTDPSTNTTVRAYQNSQGTYLQVQIFQSTTHSSSSDTDSGNYLQGSDEYLGAEQSVSVHIDILAENDTHYGGSYSMILTPFNNTWDYVDSRESGIETRHWGYYNSYSGLDEGVTPAW